MPIYTVRVEAPAINEEIVTEADDPEQAKARALGSALARQMREADVTVTEQS